MRSRDECHNYWLHPETYNEPKRYLIGEGRSTFLIDLIRKYFIDWDTNILEIGCNSGRNLNRLYEAGFLCLNGIEINPDAFELLIKTFPEMAGCAEIWNCPVEYIISDFDTDRFDLTFTLAVLEHIHPDSEFVFDHMARISKCIITVEDEVNESTRHCPRNYRKVFESRGMRQIEEWPCTDVEGLGSDFVARVLTHNRENDDK